MGKVIDKIFRLNKTGVLTNSEIKSLISDESLVIDPLLEESQIGEITIDLRIGLDFLTSNQGREAFIDTTVNNINKRTLSSHFTETRRTLGEPFLFHPSQTILFSTLEYIKLPNNVFAVLSIRSSYSRLGLAISTVVQPGYCGCLSVEITNSGKMPIKILTGTRMIQLRLYKIKDESNYFNTSRKYACQVRPVSSKANEDYELSILNGIR